MKVLLSTHQPGLNLNEARILHHKLFLNAIEHNLPSIGMTVHKLYQEKGRGVLFVSQQEWMQIIRAATMNERDREDNEQPMQFSYLHPASDLIGDAVPRFLEHVELVSRRYDPEKEFVLVVNHRTVDVWSLYWFSTEPVAPVHIAVDAEGYGA